MMHILSLGAGVQSSTLALMATLGVITPMPDCAIFADTQNEPAVVYAWLDWLEKQLSFPVHRVTAGNLWDAVVDVRTTRDGSHKYPRASIPIFFGPRPGETTITRGGTTFDTEDGSGLFGENFASRKGIGQRHCTRDYKIIPINKKILELVGHTPKDVVVAKWLGISADEAHRAKTSREEWAAHRYPLLELDITRDECLAWMSDHGYPTPPRSACTFCPFHDDESWAALTPDELADVAEKEKQLQLAYKQTTLKATPYFHASRIPIDEVKFKPKERTLVTGFFGNECEGHCGR